MSEHKNQDADAWLGVFHTQFAKETDRASVILAAAMLDDALSVCLRSHLVPCPSQDDPLFDSPTAPLSAFSSRIEFAYRIGLISKRLCRDLHLVRRIRNAFAHNVSGCDFEDTAVRNRIIELRKSFSKLSADPAHLQGFGDNPRGHFQACVGWMIWHLRTLIVHAPTLEEADLEWGYDYAATSSSENA